MAKNLRQRTPQGEIRAEAQRERILMAAQQCFIALGLNATRVADIAETAGMSPGLIYRYFSSKTEITLAVVKKQLKLTLETSGSRKEPPDIAKELTESFARAHDPKRDALHPILSLEITAEATRDPAISAALKEYENTLRDVFYQRLKRSKTEGGHGIPDELLAQRGLIIELLYQGVKMHQVHSPDLDTDLLFCALQDVFKSIFKA